VVGVFHRDRRRLKAIFLGETEDLLGVVVCQEHIAPDLGQQAKQSPVVDLPILVQTPGCNGVRRIDEKRRFLHVRVASDDFDPVTLDERKPIPHLRDLPDAPGERCWIPSGPQTATLFAAFDETRTWSEDATSLDPVAEQRGECPFAQTSRFATKDFQNVRSRDFKPADRRGQPIGLSAKNGLPDRRNVGVFFHEDGVLDKSFKAGSQTDDAAACERFHQNGRPPVLKPRTHVRH
jgi:hypothetical protein